MSQQTTSTVGPIILDLRAPIPQSVIQSIESGHTSLQPPQIGAKAVQSLTNGANSQVGVFSTPETSDDRLPEENPRGRGRGRGRGRPRSAPMGANVQTLPQSLTTPASLPGTRPQEPQDPADDFDYSSERESLILRLTQYQDSRLLKSKIKTPKSFDTLQQLTLDELETLRVYYETLTSQVSFTNVSNQMLVLGVGAVEVGTKYFGINDLDGLMSVVSNSDELNDSWELLMLKYSPATAIPIELKFVYDLGSLAMAVRDYNKKKPLNNGDGIPLLSGPQPTETKRPPLPPDVLQNREERIAAEKVPDSLVNRTGGDLKQISPATVLTEKTLDPKNLAPQVPGFLLLATDSSDHK